MGRVIPTYELLNRFPFRSKYTITNTRFMGARLIRGSYSLKQHASTLPTKTFTLIDYFYFPRSLHLLLATTANFERRISRLLYSTLRRQADRSKAQTSHDFSDAKHDGSYSLVTHSEIRLLRCLNSLTVIRG